MKKRLITLVLLTAAFSGLPLMAQNDSVKTDTAQVDEIEVYSDTTQNDTASAIPLPVDDVDDNFPFGNSQSPVGDVLGNVDGSMFVWAIVACVVLFIIFVLAPLVILGLLLWFVYKNRKDRMRLAEMAMKNGQPIPDELVKPATTNATADELRARGIRQIFLGIGLIFLLGWVASKVGVGIGIVVLCIGLGNVFIARTTKNKESELTSQDFDTQP